MDTEKFVTKKDFIYIAILMSIALIIGIYLIATTVVISQDGVLYTQAAMDMKKVAIPQQETGYENVFAISTSIFFINKLTSLFATPSSPKIWAIIGQSTILIYRLLAIIPLYFIGKLVVGKRNSFWGFFVLAFLPYPTHYGCDILRQWPHIFFLSTALLGLIIGTKKLKALPFIIAGFFSGLGYMIRPECAQILIYTLFWLGIALFVSKAKKLKILVLATILFVSFSVPAGLYAKTSGKAMPQKLKNLFSHTRTNSHIITRSNPIKCDKHNNCSQYEAAFVPAKIISAILKLCQRLCENLMYFFVAPFCIGFYKQFRKWREVLFDVNFYIFALMALYFIMMVMLYINYGYISRRHCLPMVIFGVFYIPFGLDAIVVFISKNEKSIKYFFILLSIGILICLPKLFRPLGADKKGYLDAAGWLNKNTLENNLIGVPDKRISFYAARHGFEWLNTQNTVYNAEYFVLITTQKDKNGLNLSDNLEMQYSVALNAKNKKRINIYSKKQP